MDLSWALLAGFAWGQFVTTSPAPGFVVLTSTEPVISTSPLGGGATAFPFPFDPTLQPRTVPAGFNQPGASFNAPLPSFTPAAGAPFGTPSPGAPQGPPAQPPAPTQPPPAFQQPPPAFQQPPAPVQPTTP